MASLVRRQTTLEFAETSPFSHKYLLKRPRTHESEATDEVVGLQGPGEDESHIDNPAAEKRRFELFIDLIWVGIIGNLAGHFGDQAFSVDSEFNIGRAIFEFIILFLLAWRIWKYLQEFMSKYRTNDIIERVFVIWVLILAMLYGNNAPYLLNEQERANLTIIIYLVFKASMLSIEAYYSLHLAHIRRRTFLQSALSFPTVALWIGAMFSNYPTRAALCFAAVTLEYWTAAIIETPLAERFLKDDRKEIFNTDHWVERIEDFFILILGEGVLSLIKGSPLGRGITSQAAAGVLALLIYYVLSGFFFNGDSSRRYIHAVRRTWWRRVLWQMWHVDMFASTLMLGVSIAFLLQNPRANAVNPTNTTSADSDVEFRLAGAIYTAKWTAACTLSSVLLCQTFIALLSCSLDAPRTLKVGSRYLRLLPRLFVIAVALLLPIDRVLSSMAYLGILVAVLLLCLLWEWIASLERGGGIIEPHTTIV